MRRLALLGTVIAGCALGASPGLPEPARGLSEAKVGETCTVAQLEQLLTSERGTDADLAARLAGVTLSERMGSPDLKTWLAKLPGEKSRQALLVLADQAGFLDPPPAEILGDATPDPAQTRQMLVHIVDYVNTVLRQLPNLIVTRRTTSFEDRPQEDALEATGIVSYSYLPIHYVGNSDVTLAYRDHKEVIDESAAHSLKQGQLGGGLVTSGEFGSVLISVVSDALKGKITWARWEKGAPRALAVFRYEVPPEKSNYRVKFCCVLNGFTNEGLPDRQIFDERAGYHGDITFDPADGTIFAMRLEADLPPHDLIASAGMVVEYGRIDIAGKECVCPLRSISILSAHTTSRQGMQSRAIYRGGVKTYLNDVAFGPYRRFGSEVRIIGDSEKP